MSAVQVVVGSGLTICFGFPNRDDTFDGSAFFELLKFGFSLCVEGSCVQPKLLTEPKICVTILTRTAH